MQYLVALTALGAASAALLPSGHFPKELQAIIRDNRVDELANLLSSFGDDPALYSTPCCEAGSLTALQWAAKCSASRAVVDALLDAGAPHSAPHARTLTTPLMFAAREGSTAAIESLLAHGAGEGLDAVDEHGNTPLLLAALEGWAAASQLLLDAGADASVENAQGNVALHVASFYCNGGGDVIEVLAEAGADLNVRTRSGRTALMFAVGGGSKRAAECVAALLARVEVDADVVAPNGASAAGIAEARSLAEIQAMLADRAAKGVFGMAAAEL